MAKHKRLKPIREYLFDKGEMIEQMFSSIPIVEVRNMVPMKLQGMPLHELKAECLVELLEMSDREIMNILEGKKSREEPSSSESDSGGVVVISDDEKRVKKERRSNWRPTLRKEESEGSSTERSSSNKKKKNKRKSKEKDDTKGRKKIKMESRKPTPSHSKDVPMKKEVSVKKIVAKVPERPKPPVGEVVVLDDISSEEDVSEVAIQEDVAKEGGKKTGEKSLLDLLELEMRARAIRSLLKKEEETQAQKILSEYQDEPDDLIPVEVAPPQVDLLSDSDEESNLVMKQELSVQQSAIKCLELEVEGDTLLSKDGGLDSLLGIEKDETSDVVEMIEVDELSIDSAQVNSSRQSPPAITALKQSDTSKSIEFVEETKSLGLKDASMHREIIVKIEEDIDEPNQHRKTEFLTVNSTLDSAQHSSKIQKKSANLKKSSAISNTVEIQTQQLVTSQAEIVKLKDLSHKKPLLSGEETSYSVMPNSKSSAQQADDERNNSVSVKKEPETPGYDNVFAAGKVEGKENVENVTSKTLMNVELKMSPSTTEGVDNTKEATVNAQKVCNMKSGGASVISDPAVSSVESNKPQSISAGFDSNFDEEVLDYDYDLPLMNSLRQPCVRSSPSDVGNLVLADEKMSRLVDVSSSKMPIPFELEAVTLSDDDEPDSIQPAEVKVLNQDKCDSTLDSSKERRLSEQCTSKSVCNSTQGINFLVRDALGSPELSQKTTVESQERAKIVESLDLVQGERCRVDGTINAIESASQESENLAETSIFDGRSSKITTPKVNKEVLDLENYQDSNSVQSTELMISDKVKNYCTSLGAKDKQIPPECFSEGITNESQKHGHFLVIDSLDSQEATTPGSTLDSPDSTKDPISSQMDGKAVIYSDLDCQEASKSPGSQLRETNTGGQNLVDKKASEMARSHSSASLLIKDAGKEEERSKLGEKNHDPVDEVASTQCNIIEEQHFLVDAALDSPNAERSKTKTLDQEPSELYLNVDSDVLRKRDSPLSSQNQKPGIKNLGIERDCGVYVTTEIFASNRDGHFSDDKAVESLKSGTSVTNQECLDYEVRNKESILGGADFISAVTRTQKNIPKGKIDSSIASSSLCVASINLKGQGKDTRPFENETTAFVGCNSIEIQKSVRLTNGQAVSQTNSLNNASHESLTMDCILVSSEGEDELNGVSGKNLVESIACSSKTIPACDDPSYQCASQRHPIRGSLLSVSTSSCDVLISSDDHSSHEIPCLKKILSNEGDPCRKFPSSRAIESTCEPSQPSLTVVERRGCGGPEPDEPPPGKINQENQTFPGIEHHESPCVSPAPSSIMKTSRFPIVVQDVQAEKEPSQPTNQLPLLGLHANRSGTVNDNSEIIEIDDDDSANIYSEKKPITLEAKSGVDSTPQQGDSGPTSDSSLVLIKQRNCNSDVEKQTCDGHDYWEETASPHMTTFSSPAPPTNPSNLEPTQSLVGLGEGIQTNLSETMKNNSEVIEIDDETSAHPGSSRGREPITHQDLEDSALQKGNSCPTSDTTSITKTSILEQTKPFSACLDQLEEGNSNSGFAVTREESSDVYKNEEKRNCDEPKSSNLEPTSCPLVLGLKTYQSVPGSDKSELIEIDDEDSAHPGSSRGREPITHQDLEDSALQKGDSCPTSDTTSITKTSILEQTKPFSACSDQLEEGNSNSGFAVTREESSDVYKNEEKRTCDEPKSSSLEPTSCPLVLGLKTHQSVPGSDKSELIEIDDEDSAGSCGEEESPTLKATFKDNNTTSKTKTTTLKQRQPSFPVPKNLDLLEKGNSNSEVDYSKRLVSSDVSKDERNRNSDGPDHLVETQSPQNTHSSIVSSSAVTAGNNNPEVIEIDDEDLTGICNKETSNMTKYSEETSPHQGNSSPTPTPSSVTGELCIETGDNKIVNGTNHCEIIEIDDEDSEYSSSGEDGDSETSSEESQQSYDTVHSIS
ncbi:hypothetical protein GE061_009502 [Apolygus lucorum]|uniref:Uncharacterized protein n=1 Tax=Apolygus lucorum TaxID=248454 RepID=A0A8S9Y1W1_APOLU|nr:hypothetical protein GE061_009502 [Apolygus lucorum]